MAKKGKLVRSASSKEYFKSYNIRCTHEKNKLVKMVRSYKAQPHNEQLRKRIVEILKNSVKYTRNRKSSGHTCKGMYNSLGFEKNLPSELMIKGKAPVHLYCAGSTVFKKHSEPNTGKNMRSQFEDLGFKYVKRKYKKTAR